MLAVMPFLNNNSAAMAQGYNGDNYYSQYPTDDKNMNADQVLLKASL